MGRDPVASAARYEDAFALAVLDVDAFKRINDRHGHPHGDATLKRVADVLREARLGDRPYRVGGDEFAVLLAHTDAEGAGILAQRLSHNLADAGIEVSIGVRRGVGHALASPRKAGVSLRAACGPWLLLDAARRDVVAPTAREGGSLGA
jgi:diguanylate cyclase (GGDEF)-like protein